MCVVCTLLHPADWAAFSLLPPPEAAAKAGTQEFRHLFSMQVRSQGPSPVLWGLIKFGVGCINIHKYTIRWKALERTMQVTGLKRKPPHHSGPLWGRRRHQQCGTEGRMRVKARRATVPSYQKQVIKVPNQVPEFKPVLSALLFQVLLMPKSASHTRTLRPRGGLVGPAPELWPSTWAGLASRSPTFGAPYSSLLSSFLCSAGPPPLWPGCRHCPTTQHRFCPQSSLEK